METSLENIWEQDYNNVQWPTDISSPATAWGLNMTWLFFFFQGSWCEQEC